MIWEDVPGWFDFKDTYDYIFDRVPQGGKMAEIGCYLGQSVTYMLERMFNTGKNFTLYAVDTWDGSKLVKPIDDMFKKFYLNVQQVPRKTESLHPIVAQSLEAATFFGDNSFDAVFVDADHSYKAVKDDITVWLPKVKPGGILAGHDYDNGAWVSVKNAVDEMLGDRIIVKGRCWIYIKD